MISAVTIDGRDAMAAYLDAERKPTTEDKAAFIKVLFLDGGSLWLIGPMVLKWNEAEHPRVPAGSSEGGQFTEADGGNVQTEAIRKLPDVQLKGTASKAFARSIERHLVDIATKYPKLIKTAEIKSTAVYTKPDEYDIKLSDGRLGSEILPEDSAACYHRKGLNQLSAFEINFKLAEGKQFGRGRNMVLHEVGHAYDDVRVVSKTNTFRLALNSDRQDMSRVSRSQFAYFASNAGEAFAETVARILGPELDDSANFRKTFPSTIQVVENALRRDGILPGKPNEPGIDTPIEASSYDLAATVNRDAVATARQMGLPVRERDPKAPVYLRIGGWDPKKPQSQNYATGDIEAGLSVYELDKNGKPVAPAESEWAEDDLRDRMRGDEPKFLVQGMLVGEGHDGEPLLGDPAVVGGYKDK